MKNHFLNCYCWISEMMRALKIFLMVLGQNDNSVIITPLVKCGVGLLSYCMEYICCCFRSAKPVISVAKIRRFLIHSSLSFTRSWWVKHGYSKSHEICNQKSMSLVLYIMKVLCNLVCVYMQGLYGMSMNLMNDAVTHFKKAIQVLTSTFS